MYISLFPCIETPESRLTVHIHQLILHLHKCVAQALQFTAHIKVVLVQPKLTTWPLSPNLGPLTYRQTQPCWTGWRRPEGGRCSRTCCRSCRCWPQTGWRRRRPGGASPSKTLRRERTSSSWEISVRRRKRLKKREGCTIPFLVFITFFPPSFSPPPPAGHLTVCLQISALACPSVL